jgi:hypothetical protein
LLVRSRRMRASKILAGACGLALAMAACSSATPTPIYIQLTPTPAPTGTPTPVATPTPTPTPTPSPTVAATATAEVTATATAAATGTAGATPTSPAAGCSGNASNQPFWVQAVNSVPFSVYCGVISSPWSFDKAGATFGSTGTVVAVYKTKTGGLIVLLEGAFCTGAKPGPPHGASITTAKFGDLDGTLYPLTTGYVVNVPSVGAYATMAAGQVIISSGTSYGYAALSNNVSQASFVAIAAALFKVPKS